MNAFSVRITKVLAEGKKRALARRYRPQVISEVSGPGARADELMIEVYRDIAHRRHHSATHAGPRKSFSGSERTFFAFCALSPVRQEWKARGAAFLIISHAKVVLIAARGTRGGWINQREERKKCCWLPISEAIFNVKRRPSRKGPTYIWFANYAKAFQKRSISDLVRFITSGVTPPW